jgi:molecular chaperone DnaJ
MEAYQVLSNHVQRDTYNYQRWHQRIKGKKYDTLAFSPQTILSESISLREYMAIIDVFRMNQYALDHQLREVLSNHNLSILKQFNDTVINRQVIHELLQAARPLHYSFIEPLAQRLIVLAGNDTEATEEIKKYTEKSRRTSQWNRYKIVLIILITCLLCLLIYFLSK